MVLEDNFDFEDYQKLCKNTASKETRLVGWTLGLCGESGEFADIVKKYTEHGVTTLKNGKNVADAMREELGDVLFYIAMLCNELDINMGDVAQENVKKLQARYPDGFVEGGGIR